MRGVYRDFHGSVRDSLQSQKTLRKFFFQKFSFKCSGGWPWRLARNLMQSRKTHVLHRKILFLYWFQKGFSFLSLASSYCSSSTPSCSHTSVSTNLSPLSHSSRKGLGFCLLLFIFLIYCIFLLDCVFLLIFVYLLIVHGYLIFW